MTDKNSRDKLLESLEDATRRMKDAKAAKKRDAAVHRGNIKDIQEEIDEIMVQLDADKA